MSLANRAARATALAIACATVLACIGFRGPADVKRDLERRTNSDLDREFAITLGPATMAFARWAVGSSEDGDGIPIRGVRKVQVGVYVRDDRDGRVRLDRHLEARDFPDFEPMVEVRDRDERVLVMAASRGDRLRKMVVVVDDLDEVVIVRLSGDLDTIVEEAIRMALDEADRDDLADETVDAWRHEQETLDGV